MTVGAAGVDGIQHHAPASKKPRPRRLKRQPITYVSRHFSIDEVEEETVEDAKDEETATAAPETQLQPQSQPRIYYGVNIDEAYSSDSSLSSVPDDIGPDPFSPSPPPTSKKPPKRRKPTHPTKSPFFPFPHKPRSHFLSTLPFPPLSAPTFGLMQERLASNPFRLLIATIFLNKTPGERAMPTFFQLMDHYPTPSDLAAADTADVVEMIRHLGFQNQRAAKCVAMAKVWCETPPVKGKRTRKKDYPLKGDGRNIQGEVLDDEDERIAWEISHLPGLGAYAHDSWRMFCRDSLRGLSTGWNGEEAAEGFEPEWTRVLPLDKELRAWMTWMWLKEGWVWDKETGERTRASEELMTMARGGGIVVEEREKATLTVQALPQANVEVKMEIGKVARPAGDILGSEVLDREIPS